jgi:hypothetical protein
MFVVNPQCSMGLPINANFHLIVKKRAAVAGGEAS